MDSRKFEFIKGLSLAEPLKDEVENLEIDLLIGQDYYNDVVGTRRMELEKGLYLVKSIFGWILCGRVDAQDSKGSAPVTALVIPSAPPLITPTDAEMEKFWSLEAIGVTESSQSRDDDVALRKVLDTMTFKNGRYQVRFPWKEPPLALPKKL